MRTVRFAALVCFSVVLSGRTLEAQKILPAPPQDQFQQGSQQLQKSAAALGAPITDVSLSGTITVTIGSNTQSGTFVLTATSAGKSRALFQLPNGTQTEVEDYVSSPHTGQLTTAAGETRQFHAESLLAPHPAWFFPSFLMNASLSDSYKPSLVGQETKNGSSVGHVTIYGPQSQASSNSVIAVGRPDQIDVYVDPSSQLPEIIDFIVPVSGNDPKVTPFYKAQLYGTREIRYSDYRLVQNRPVAFHIQVCSGDVVIDDLRVTSANINTGVSISSAN